MRTSAPLVAPVFRSDGQARLLSALLLVPSAELSVSELAERAVLAYPSAHREVRRLLDAGIVVERRAGRTRLIRANEDSPLVPPLREIAGIVDGPVVLLARELGAIDGVDAAFLYGSFAARATGTPGPAPIDIDVMVVGAPDPDAVYRACDRVETTVRRPVNPTILSGDEIRQESAFLAHLRQSPVLRIVGDLPWA